METRTVELNVQTNSSDAAAEFKRLHDEIALAQQELEGLTQELGASNTATVAAQKKVNDLRGAYDQLNQSVTDVDGTFAQVYGETLQPLTTRLGEAEDRLYELALAGKQNTQEYKDLMVAAQGYLRTQQQVDLQVDAGSMPMAQKLTTAVGGVAGGFAAAEGAIALFGVESEAVQQTLVKLNALLAITGGMTAIKESIPIFQNMGTAAKNALSSIKTGVAATGIGLLVIAVGTLVAYWDDIKIAISGAGKEQEKLAKNAQKKVEADKLSLGIYEKEWELLKAQGKTEKEIAKLQLGKLNTMIKNAEVAFKTAQKTRESEIQSSKWWASFWESMWKASAFFLDSLLSGLDLIGEAFGQDWGLSQGLENMGKSFVKMFADPDAVKAEQDKIVAESQSYLLDLQIKYKEAENIITGTANSTTTTIAETAKQKIDLERENRDKRIALMEDGYEKEKLIAEARAKDAKEDLEKRNKEGIIKASEYAEAQKLIQLTLDKELKDLEDKYFKDKLKARDFTIQGLIDQKTKETEIEMAASMKKIQIAKEEAAKKKEIEEELQKAKFQITKDTLDLISGITELFGRQNEKAAKRAFLVDKAAKLASATVAGIEGTIEAYKTAQKSPITAVFPAYPAIQAGLAGAFAAVNIAKIAQTKFGSGNNGSDLQNQNATGGNGMTAQFNTIGTSGINQLATLQQQPVQAYVVSGEVTSAQALERNRVQNATL